MWLIDGYDKLKQYGFCVSGAIDGYSRRILWLEVAISNNNPGIIANYFLNCVKEVGGTARIVRADNGTENTYVAGLQRFFRHNSTDSFAGDKSFMYGRSVSNQRIEAWRSQLRRGCTNWWMGHFKELRENGLYCDLNPVQVEQGSTAITTYKHMGQPWAHAGTAPSYANIFMTDLENKLLDNSPNNLQLLIWKRYIDDIFVVSTHGEESLHTFMNHLNTSQPTIKFEHEYSHSNLHFLDTTVTLTQQGTLVTSLYTKPTDRTLLLHNKSHHPAIHCKQGVIYSQALRYRRITTRRGVFKQTRQTENNPPYKELQG